MDFNTRQKEIRKNIELLAQIRKNIESLYDSAVEENMAKFPTNFDLSDFEKEPTVFEQELNAEIRDLREVKEKMFDLKLHIEGYAMRDSYTVD